MKHEDFYRLCDDVRLGPPNIASEAVDRLRSAGATVMVDGLEVTVEIEGVRRHFTMMPDQPAIVIPVEDAEPTLFAAVEKQMRGVIDLVPKKWTAEVITDRRDRLDKMDKWITTLEAGKTRSAYEQWSSSAKSVVDHWEYQLKLDAEADAIELPRPPL